MMNSQSSEIARRAFLLFMLAFFLLPVVWLLTTAYKPSADIFSVPPTMLFKPTLEQFAGALEVFDVTSLITASLLITGGTTVLSLLLGIPAGYSLARSTHPMAMKLAYFFMAIRMIPVVAVLIPFYLFMRDIGLLGTWMSVVVINCIFNTAFVSWMMFSYFRSQPKELEEAALTDGCSQFTAFWKVAVPAARSGIIASALFCVLFAWNDFLFGMFLTSLDDKPISVALLSAYGTKDINWGTLGALAHFSTLPIVLIVMVLNKYFVQGITKGIH